MQWARSQEHQYQNLIKWLRLVNANNKNHAMYRHATTPLGTKIQSIFNQQYFFQYIFLHVPRRELTQLKHGKHENLPENLQQFASAKMHFAELFLHNENFKQHSQVQGHRETYICTILSYIQVLNDMLYLTQMNVIHHATVGPLQPIMHDTKCKHMKLSY